MTVSPEIELANAEGKTSLFQFYSELFECVHASTEALIDECYRLRYQVYTRELGYTEPNPDAGEYERDAYDGQSLHMLLRHRKTGEFVGTVRLIMGDNDYPRRLPLFDISDEQQIPLPSHFYTEKCAEISRFCISRNFRRRASDNIYGTVYDQQDLGPEKNRFVPFMALGLIAKVFKTCEEMNIYQACAVIEPELIAMVGRLGIHFNVVGKPFAYHGERQIAYIRSDEMLPILQNEQPDIYDLLVKLK